MADEILEEIKNMRTKFDESMVALEETQKLAKDLDKKSIDSDTVIQTAAEASAKAAEEVQEAKQRLDAIEKTCEFVQKSMERMTPAGGTDTERKEFEEKCQSQMFRYLRNKTSMDEDVVKATAEALVRNSLHGASESEIDAEVKSLMVGSNPDGGYFVRPEQSTAMIKRMFETSPIRQFASVSTTSSDSLEFVIDDNESSTGGWVGEVDDRPNTGTPKIGKLAIPVHEQYAAPLITQKMLDNSGFNVESWLNNKTTDIMTRTENSAFVVGDGAQKPRGILTLPAWNTNGVYQRGAIEQVDSGANGDFVADTIKLLQNSVIEDYQASSVFGMQRSSWQQVTTLKDLNGQYLLDSRSLKTGDTMILLGKPVVFMNDIPAAATDSLSMIYGDLGRGYTVVDKLGFRIIVDKYTQKPYVLYYTTKYVGGDVTNYESFKIYKLSA